MLNHFEKFSSPRSFAKNGFENIFVPHARAKIKYKNNKKGFFETDKDNLVKMISWDRNFIDVEIDENRIRSKVTFENGLLLIQSKSGDVLFKVLPKFNTSKKEIIEGGLNAPMPGKVVDIKIKKGAKIKKGDTLVILEAMKMEHKVVAPSDGKVKEILIQKDEQVENGATLVVLD